MLALAFVASALAAGGISFVSKKGTMKAGESATARAKCGSDREAVSAGFDGAFRGSFMGTPRITYAADMRLDGRRASLTEENLGGDTASFKASAACGSQSVSEKSKSGFVPAGAYRVVKAKCPRGRSAISGGFKSTFSAQENSGAVAASSYRSGRRQWSVGFAALPNGGSNATAYAYCAKADPLKVRAKTKTLMPIEFGGPLKATNVVADCKQGEQVVAGGFRPEDVVTANGPVTIDSIHQSNDSWRIASAVSTEQAEITAYAYCGPK